MILLSTECPTTTTNPDEVLVEFLKEPRRTRNNTYRTKPEPYKPEECSRTLCKKLRNLWAWGLGALIACKYHFIFDQLDGGASAESCCNEGRSSCDIALYKDFLLPAEHMRNAFMIFHVRCNILLPPKTLN